MLTATGIGSGLDIEGLVNQLIAAERAPTDNRLTRQEAQLTAELSAFGSFKGALAGFQNSLASLNNPSNFGQRIATSSAGDIIAASAGPEATAGSYDLTVSQLAKAHSLASGSYAAASDTVGTGTLTIRFGTTDYTPPVPGPESYDGFTVNAGRGVANIAIDTSNNTLEGIRDAVNDADIGVSAAIVNDGSGFRLLLSSDQTGSDNSLQISVDDLGDGDDLDGSGLSALAFNSGATHLSQTVVAQDAVFSINGLSINSSNNTAADVIDGVEINLKDLTGAAPVTVTVEEDHGSVKQAINALVAGYNSFIQNVNTLTAYDPETGIAGSLQGDFSARSIANSLRQTLTNAVAGFNGPFSTLSEIGITTTGDGTLLVDDTTLERALDDNFDKMVGLFAEVGLPSDGNIKYLSASEETRVGAYAVNISQGATQGQLIAAVAAFPLDIDDDNDGLTIKVNGIESGGISLSQGSYASGGALAAELQSRINGDSTLAAAGITVAVAFNVDHFEITSDSHGGDSTVEITAVDTNSAAELGLSLATGVAGLDVAGTIGGSAATGTGQLLKGGSGSDTEGLQLLIQGGAEGDRGNVEFSRGIAYQLDALITGFLDSGGLLDSRTDGIQSRVDDISDRREVLNRRIDTLELRYRAQFNALDGLLAQLRTTSDFLAQQLASLPEAGTLLKSNN